MEEYNNIDPGAVYRDFYNNNSRDPRGGVTIPVESDYKKGWFWRYFIRNTNDEEALPFEITKEEFDSWAVQNSGISQSDWAAIKIRWKISGPKERVLNSLGFPERHGVLQTNLNIIDFHTGPESNNSLKYLDTLLTDPLQYWNGRNNRD